ncbi:MAG: hypothetical protein R2757_21285 [Draconibacterium sp.]
MPNNKHNKHFEGLKLILLLLSTLFPFGYLLSQNTGTPISSNIVKSELDKLYGVDQRLVSGDFYAGAPLGSVSGHPYFFDETWKEGSVTIEGIKYNNLLLKFDVASDMLVLKTYTLNNNTIQLCLKKEKISGFTMNEAKFIRFPDENKSKKIVFAQLCSEGNVDFLLVRNKVMTITNGGDSDFIYKEYFQNYLRYKGQVIKFNNKKTLYKLFPEYKPALKKYLSQNNLSTSKKDTHNLTMLVDYCNSLLNNSK